MALAKILSRMSKQGILGRIEKGLYYKPKETAFGTVRPSEREVLKAILEEKKGYISGISAANVVGITPQIAKEIVIASGNYRPPRKIAGLTIRFRRAKIGPGKASVTILQILDSLQMIKKIPGVTVDDALRSVISSIRIMTQEEKRELISCALEYNPSVRALVGAIVSLETPAIKVSSLKKSLNVLSKYRIGVSEEILPNKEEWRII
jgi:hypothetical protein